MYLLLSYLSGVTVEAVILARAKNRMRVAVAGLSDTIELKCSGSQWFADRQPVVFDFAMSMGDADSKILAASKPARVACTAAE